MLIRARLFRLFVVFLLGVWTAGALAQDAVKRAEEVLTSSVATLERFLNDPKINDPAQLLGSARGIFIIPEASKLTLFVGFGGYTGVLLRRDPETDQWSAPAFYNVTEASVGLQVGMKTAEGVVLLMTDAAIQDALDGSLSFGGSMSVAAGPLTAGMSSGDADALSYITEQGVFAGVSMDGFEVKYLQDMNDAFYGATVSPEAVLYERLVDSGPALILRERLAQAG